jgi:hypothetical protein
LTGSVWNSGDFPISKPDVRLPLSLDLRNSNRILDFKITKEKDAAVAGFSLERVSSNSLQIDWKYFDPDFGFSFQIIYVGESDPTFHFDGKVLNISNFTKLDKLENKSLRYKLLLLSCTFFAIIGYVIMFVKERRTNNALKILSLILLALSIFCFIYFTWAFFFRSTNAPI